MKAIWFIVFKTTNSTSNLSLNEKQPSRVPVLFPKVPGSRGSHFSSSVSFMYLCFPASCWGTARLLCYFYGLSLSQANLELWSELPKASCAYFCFNSVNTVKIVLSLPCRLSSPCEKFFVLLMFISLISGTTPDI